MFGLFKEKTPQQKIRNADRSTQKLRDKRSKLDPRKDKDKIGKINAKIHKNNVEIDIAHAELRQPKKEIKRTTTNISFNQNDNSKQLHLHGHYHNNRKKK